MQPVGDESGGESLEEPIELQSGAELSGSDVGSEDFENTNRWLDDLGDDELDDAPEEGQSGEPEDSEDQDGETRAKRPRLMEDRATGNKLRGGPPRMPDGSTPPPPPGYDEEGYPLPERKKRRRKKKRGKKEGRALPMPRPPEMTKAEMEKHRREGHANYHPGCKHCVKSRALADQH